MLPTKVCKLHNPISVDNEERRTLAQRKELALDLISFIESVIRIHQTGERDGIVGEIGSNLLLRVSHDGDNRRTRVKELLMLYRQLTEVPTAKRSLEAPQKHQHHASPAAIITQGDVPTHRVRESEIRS